MAVPRTVVSRATAGLLMREAIEEHYSRHSDREWMKSRSATFDLDGEAHKAASLAALTTWEAECAEVDRRHDVPALEAVSEAAWARLRAAERAIIDPPATSVVGVAVKLALWVDVSIEAQEAFQEPENANFDVLFVMAAWRDAVRLAGLPHEYGMEGYKDFLARMARERAGPVDEEFQS